MVSTSGSACAARTCSSVSSRSRRRTGPSAMARRNTQLQRARALPRRRLARDRDHRRRLVNGITVGQRAEGLDLGRPAEQVALRLVAQLVLEELELGVGFHAL